MEVQQEASSDMMAEQERQYYGRQHKDTQLCRYESRFSERFYSKKLVFLLRDTHGRSIHDD
jgi:hypothetical protein